MKNQTLPKTFIRKTKSAFTLAEVLVTLALIGVVAAMSIPGLQHDISEKELKTLYKKAYGEGSSAFKQAVSENILKPISSKSSDVNNAYNFSQFMTKFNVQKDCRNNNAYDCWEQSGEKINTYPRNDSYAFTDSAGRTWSMKYNTAHLIFVDTNGKKKPNKFGKDRMILIMDTNTENQTGSLQRLIPDQDYDEVSSNRCTNPPCPYQSWLIH